MPTLQEILYFLAILILVVRLILVLREQQFAEQLLLAGVRWTDLRTAHLFDIKQGLLWQAYLWSFRWRQLTNSASRIRCAKWFAVDTVFVAAFFGLMILAAHR